MIFSVLRNPTMQVYMNARKKEHLQTALIAQLTGFACFQWDILTPAGAGWNYIMCFYVAGNVCLYVYWPPAEGQQSCGSLRSAGVWRRSCRGQGWVSHSGDFSGAYSWHLPPQGCSATPPPTPLPTSSVKRSKRENKEGWKRNVNQLGMSAMLLKFLPDHMTHYKC